MIGFIRGFAFILMMALATAATAQSYPNKPIRLVVPYPPGALTDLLGRAIGERLAAGLKQPVVIENRPGAGTLVGADVVAKAAPDGYTLLMATSTTLGISPAMYSSPRIDPVRDFAPIAQAGAVTFFLIANPSFPAKNVKEMIETIRASPGKFNYASVGAGSPHQLYMEVIKKEFGLDIQHIPYKGTLLALPDLLTGKVQVMFCDATAALPNIQAGKVLAYGTSSARQTSLAPSIPPVANSIPGFDWQAWQGIVAPAGTPRAIIAALSAEMQRILSTQEFRDVLTRFGMDPAPPHTPEQFADLIRRDQERWAKAVSDSGAKVD
jgi:tripartite-type tricarboxylate transporter receptor subunit TctC